MTRPVILDTNVVVSALLTREAGAPTARILDAVLSGDLHVVLSLDLLAEYREVLLRPAIRRRHGLSDEEVDDLLAEITAMAAIRETPPVSAAERGRDAHLHLLCRAAGEAILVTGDEALRASGPGGIETRSPRELVGRRRP